MMTWRVPKLFWNMDGGGGHKPGGGSLLKALAQRFQAQTLVATDARLERLRAGHVAAIDEALADLAPKVRGWVYRRIGPDGGADDVTQEVLTEIARALPSFEGQSSLVTYAYRICRRVIGHQLKRRRRGEETPAGSEIEENPCASVSGCDPERAAIARQALRRVLHCLDRMPARCREAFILCELEGASPEEAAELIGTTPNAVRSRLMRARRELERRLHARLGVGTGAGS
jgi:RNA polymerase sigma-70 factor (ECF subfamily)